MNGKIGRRCYILIGILIASCAACLFICYRHYHYLYSPPNEMLWLVLFLFFGGIIISLKHSTNPEIRFKGVYSIIFAFIFWFFSVMVFAGMQDSSDPPPNMAVGFALISFLVYDAILVVNGIFLLFAKRWAVKFYKWLLILWFPVFMVLGMEEGYIRNSHHITICVLLNISLVLMGVLYLILKKKIVRKKHGISSVI